MTRNWTVVEQFDILRLAWSYEQERDDTENKEDSGMYIFTLCYYQTLNHNWFFSTFHISYIWICLHDIHSYNCEICFPSSCMMYIHHVYIGNKMLNRILYCYLRTSAKVMKRRRTNGTLIWKKNPFLIEYIFWGDGIGNCTPSYQ